MNQMSDVIEGLLLTTLGDVSAASARTPFDAVVAGAGTAGITVARTLVEAGRRVAVLESGPLALLTHISSTGLRFDPVLSRSVQSGLQYSPQAPDGTQFGALIACVGGRGMFWNGASPRFLESDFKGWPLQFPDLEPYYEWAEQQFRVSRDYGSGGLGQTVVRLLRRAGYAAEFLPFAVDTRATRDGWLGGTIGNSVEPLLRTGYLTAAGRPMQLATGAFANRIILNDQADAAYGVEVSERATGKVFSVKARSVVLAAGGFESVKLALISAVGDKSGLIGRMITDHLFCRAYYPVPAGIYRPDCPEASMILIRPDATKRYQVEVHLPDDNIFNLKGNDLWKPDGSQAYAFMVRSFAPVLPRVENYIEARAGGPGSFVVHFSYSSEDLQLRDQMVAGLEAVRNALSAGAALQLQIMPPGASHHEAGGLAMGTDPKSSVTDAYGRFHTVQNVVVADAAAWPDVVAANPHLTIAAIARRQARQLSKDLA
jgi:choline dehydrogenase-like flavoprotein